VKNNCVHLSLRHRQEKERERKRENREIDLAAIEQGSLFEGRLLLRVLDQLFLNKKSFSAADGIHVPESDVLAVSLLAKVLQLLVGRGHPEGVLVEELPPVKEELRAGEARRLGANLCGKAKALDHREGRPDDEDGRALLHVFSQNLAFPL